MSTEVSLSMFERNAKKFNKKGLRRDYHSIPLNYSEYVPFPPAYTTKKIVLQITVDKGNVSDLIKYFEDKGFKNIGSINYLHLEELINQYNNNKDKYTIDSKVIEAITKDYELQKEQSEPFKEVENDDAVFYLVPFNDTIETLFEFIKTQKDGILKFAQDNDITIMSKIIGFSNQLDGFLGFNFFDADKETEEVIDYAARVTVGVDFKNRVPVYNACVLLSSIGENEDELTDSDINCHIVAENARNLE